jgi:glycosyltransferase involved in cell wall biosynthesis
MIYNLNKLLKKELGKNRSFLNEADEPFILFYKCFSKAMRIRHSVVLPVYNQEELIPRVLEKIINNTKSNFELIIILDACTDDSEKNILNFLTQNEKTFPKNLHSVTIVKQPTTPIFEASCDNIGFILSRGKYCLEIQSDMLIEESGYDLQLEKPFKLFPDCIGVSAKCCHALYDHKEASCREDRNIFYIRGTCNRGPLMLDKEKLKELNYLDEKNYYLGDSDHDLFARARLEKKYICGHTSIKWKGAPAHSKTRQERDDINELYLKKRAEQSSKGIYSYKKEWIEPQFKEVKI